MAALSSSISLQDELQHLTQVIRPGEPFTCYGKALKGKRCCKPLGQERRDKLEPLLKDILEALATFGNGLVHLLQVASSLVMCGLHEDQASKKFEEWIERIPAENPDVEHSGDQVGIPYFLNQLFT
jgi:hypothetical protein